MLESNFAVALSSSEINCRTYVSFNGSLSPSWVELPQNWTLKIPITYRLNYDNSSKNGYSSDTIIISCVDDKISITGGNTPGGKASYSWIARGYYYNTYSYFTIGTPTLEYTGLTPKDFEVTVRINSQIYDYSNYSGGWTTDYGSASNKDVVISFKKGNITYNPSSEILTSSYGSSTSNDGHTLKDEFHLNSMTLQSAIIHH